MLKNKKIALMCILLLSACTSGRDWSSKWIIVGVIRPGPISTLTSKYAVNEDTLEVERNLPWDIGIHPEWSTNGQWIVFERWILKPGTPPQTFLYLSDANTGRITELGETPGNNPTWSHDGSHIAYSNSGDIYILNIECYLRGEKCDPDPVFLTQGNSPDWSINQAQIVYEHEGNIFIINSQGGDVPREISVQLPACFDPEWSPDGTRIAFGCSGSRDDYYFAGNGDIYLMSADGSGLINLTIIGGGISPQWSPDGNRIAFISIRDDLGEWVFSDFQTRGLFIMDLGNNQVVRLPRYEDEKVDWFTWIR